MLVQEIVNTLIQIAVVMAIAAIVYFSFGRQKAGFLEYVGLHTPNRRSLTWAFGFVFVAAAAVYALHFIPSVRDAFAAENTVAGGFRKAGMSGEVIATMLVVALFKTGLTEEILFRGIIAKRLIAWLGLTAGNIVQALIFAAIHLAIFLTPGAPDFTPALAAAMVGMPFVLALVGAYVNERIGNGSIIPSWIMHGVGNAIAYPLMAFA